MKTLISDFDGTLFINDEEIKMQKWLRFLEIKEIYL